LFCRSTKEDITIMKYHKIAGSKAYRGMATALSLTILAGLPAAAIAQIAPREDDPMTHVLGHGAGSPFLDARLDEQGLAGARAKAAIAAREAQRIAARQQAINALRAAVPTVQIDDDQVMGTPHFVRSTEEFLTGPGLGGLGQNLPGQNGPGQNARGAGVAPLAVVRDFVSGYQGLFEIAPAEIDSAKLIRNFVTDHNGVTHLTFQQQIAGVDLFKAEMIANVMPDGRLINIGGSMLPRPEGDFVVAAPKISAAQAIVIAAANVGTTIAPANLVMSSDSALKPAGDSVGPAQRQVWITPPELRPDESVVTEFVYFPLTRDEIHPAWTVVVPQIGVGHTYDIVVDALTGEVLYRTNRLCYATTQPITFRVYTSDSPAPGSPGTSTPSGFQFPFVARSLVTVTPAQMAPFSPNGWINDGGTETLGNNCDGHLDRDGTPNSPDLPRPNGGAARVFDFAQDNAADPLTWSNASATQLFYYGNVYHDKLMSVGFNEAAGNFQTINFTGIGAGGDAVQLDCQDGSGTNNANFGTAADGTTGRCQMYIFTGPTPDRDGSLDADIVYHELTHGTSIRLHGGSGLSGPQAGGMGEGWSDFVGMCLSAQPTDDPNGVYAAGGYATQQLVAGYNTNYYFGIRRFPYSTDMTKNPETYFDINTASFPPAPFSPVTYSPTPSEVHNVGEIWCMALWEARAAMTVTQGFSANDVILRLVIDGMKLDPRPPNLIQARDSILQADLVLTGGTNRPAIWAAFAKRGLGSNATSPNGNQVTGITEDFGLTFTFPDGTPSQALPGVATNFRVNVAPTNANITITPNSGTIYVSINGGAYTASPMTQTSPGQYVATISAQPCNASIAYYVEVGTNSNVVRRTSPQYSTLEPYTATVFTSDTSILSDDFETNQGWSTTVTPVVVGTTTTGAWERVVPIASPAAAPGADHTPGTGTRCFVTQNGVAGGAEGSADIDNATVALTSPRFSLAGVGDAVVEYWRWYDNSRGGAPGADTMVVGLSSNDGGTFTTVETVGPATENTGGWIYHSFKMSDFPAIAKTANMRLRFTASDVGTGSVVEAAVDDVRVFVRACTASCPCVADFDGSGGTPDAGDIDAFFVNWLAGDASADADCSGGTPDAGDIDSFFVQWLAGGC
jgi:hypothetical protein